MKMKGKYKKVLEEQNQFQNKNLIVIEDKKNIQINTIDELNILFFGEEYKEKKESDKILDRYKKIYPYSLLNDKNIYLNKNTQIINGKMIETKDIDIEQGLFIKDDISFYLSLCKINALKILEKKSSNIFTSSIDKSKMEGNYVLVNFFADEIIEKGIR